MDKYLEDFVGNKDRFSEQLGAAKQSSTISSAAPGPFTEPCGPARR